MAFATLICSELLRAYTSRSECYSVFSISPFSNRWLVMATGLSFCCCWLRLRAFPEPVFGTMPLALDDWLLMVPFMLITPMVAELVKAFFRWRTSRRASHAAA